MDLDGFNINRFYYAKIQFLLSSIKSSCRSGKQVLRPQYFISSHVC